MGDRPLVRVSAKDRSPQHDRVERKSFHFVALRDRSFASLRSGRPWGSHISAGPVAPPSGTYQGFYYGGVGTDTHDPTEHDVLPQDVDRYEKTVGANRLDFFSDNWFEASFRPTCSWIRDRGKIPYLRLMLRSDVDQLRADSLYAR